MAYYHSVRLNFAKCVGCTNCIKHCPTEAIRVRDGKARIIGERCIDCGECIRVCPQHAKLAQTDPIDAIFEFEHRIALPAPSLYAQFRNLKSVSAVNNALLSLGFNSVFEVAYAAEIVSEATRRDLLEGNREKPVISSACPAVVRLIQVRFPQLLDNLSMIDSPMEVAANIAKREYSEKHGVPISKIGAFFITPCAAKMTSIKSVLGMDKSAVDGAISILDIYAKTTSILNAQDANEGAGASTEGIGWALSGGESSAMKNWTNLSVDGIHNVIKVLEAIEDGKLPDLDFFEGLACVGGCVGGPLVFENGFVGRANLQRLMERMEKREVPTEKQKEIAGESFIRLKKKINPRDEILRLDENMGRAMEKVRMIEQIRVGLPGLDCGSCGSPSCAALAEDIVSGDAEELDCIFKLKEKVQRLAEEMVMLAKAKFK